MKNLCYEHPENKDFTVTTDPSLLDVSFVHQFLIEESYWAKNAEIAETKALLEDDLCFGLFHKKEQIGFASVTTDYSSYAYISDVFVLENYRKKGLAEWMLKCVLSHPRLKNIQNLMLLTDDAHGLYEKMGFQRVPGSDDQMVKSKASK